MACRARACVRLQPQPWRVRPLTAAPLIRTSTNPPPRSAWETAAANISLSCPGSPPQWEWPATSPVMPPRPPSFDTSYTPFVAGSFDFPPASTSVSSRDGGDAMTEESAPTGQQNGSRVYRERLRPGHARRGNLHRIFGPPRDTEFTDDLSRRPPTAHPNRPRATPSERYLRRSQDRIRAQRAAEFDSATEMIDSLTDSAMSNPFYLTRPYTRPRSPIVEINSERRNKRRKLEHEPSGTVEYTCYKYGYKGQVVPGRLRMEIVSCDGGEHRKDSPPGLYRIQNVLRNDKSVYCSESSQCNLLLKHIGEAAFALEKIVIRAPDRGFTAPVQEGLVFVSMSADDLLSGTSAYNLRYHPRSPFISPSPSSPDEDEEQLSLRQAIEDPHVWQQSRRDVQEDMEERIENLRLRSERLNAASANLISSLRSDRERRSILRQMVEHEDENENCEHGTDESYTGPAGISAPTPPPFTVTTASEEDESETSEEMPSAAIMADRLRRESRWRPNSDDEEDEAARLPGSLRRASALNYATYSEWRERRERHTEPLRASRVAAPSCIESTALASDLGTLIAPHAQFFIAKNRSKITIKFHPAISGKHVLLKFWSPKHDGNIDIESVQFYGYSGPRFFPAMQPR